ncbi:hypothetical protein RIF29_19627 [Crotalaria pallida]|uniref:Secreted protein n=1 Tax=Crotalaria pallida TaxID=3830 RepID=A0AAN9I7W4_CROPI
MLQAWGCLHMPWALIVSALSEHLLQGYDYQGSPNAIHHWPRMNIGIDILYYKNLQKSCLASSNPPPCQ